MTDTIPGYTNVAFHGRFQQLVNSRVTRGVKTTRPVSSQEAILFAERLRMTMAGVADDEAILRVLNRNPQAIRVVEKDGDASEEFLAYLPLTARGLDALTNGRLDRAAPDPAMLTHAGDRPVALYIWCVYAPGSFVSVISAMAAHFGDLAPEGLPLLTSAANAHAARIFEKLGFERATQYFPRAPDDVLIVLPAAAATATGGASIVRVTTRVGRTIDDVLKVFAIRAATYMNEQSCPYNEEFDGNDFCAAHILAEIDGEPAGCIRVRFFAEFVKFERLAVRPEFRTSSLAFRLVRAAMDYARAKGFRQVYGHARADLVGFWERFGFEALPDRPVFAFSGVPYIEMAGPLQPSNRALRIGDPPMMLVRPEGAWDRPGPLEPRAALRAAA